VTDDRLGSTDATAASLTAGVVRAAIGLLYRRMRQTKATEEVSLPESSAISRLNHTGPMTAAQLAKLEQVTPQSIGVTIAGLEARGLIEKQPDPEDGRRLILSLSDTGRDHVAARRTARTEQLAGALADGFTAAELATLRAAAPLLERLAHKL
jgi:DNA-binding MarR family transcriptional regulator